MSKQFLSWCILIMTVGGVLYLALLALNKGPEELMALAAVITAGATLASTIKKKD